jgi:hypothetical protein
MTPDTLSQEFSQSTELTRAQRPVRSPETPVAKRPGVFL